MVVEIIGNFLSIDNYLYYKHSGSWDSIVSRIKRYADEHPEAPPVQILRNKLRDVAPGNNIMVLLKISYLFLNSKFL